MTKEKIAISIDKSLLKLIDSKIDHKSLRSRSQAIEFFLRKGTRDEAISTAVILLKGDRQDIALRNYKGKPLIIQQITFFEKIGITKTYLLTQSPKKELREVLRNSMTEIIECDARGNALALKAIKDKIRGNVLVMSGDTFNSFDTDRMISKHISLNRLVTIGLITKEDTKGCGTVILDGDMIIDFKEKSSKPLSHIVNAGIYLFKPEALEAMEGRSLEEDVFPLLAKNRELIGFFTYGEYERFRL